MKHFILCCSFAVLFLFSNNIVIAQDITIEEETEYRRSSLYSLLITHPKLKFNNEIYNAFMSLETPDKYNNHDLQTKSVISKKKKKQVKNDIEKYLKREQVAKDLVSKWFERDPITGGFNVNLIMERGLYDADVIDVEAAKQSKRGIDALADKGFELIENTFVIVNDITYVDHEENAKKASQILGFISDIAKGVTGQQSTIISEVANLGASISDQIAGFTVNITTYLYQLEWNDSTANYFYEKYYFEDPNSNSTSISEDAIAKKNAYDSDLSTFKLKYVGSYKEKSAKPVLRGLHRPEDVFRKVCARAIDKNIVMLQKKFDQFKVKVPLYSTKPLIAKIGMKEGVSPKSKYEVLMPEYNKKTGKIEYHRKGVIKPHPRKIWDNRFMATEEQAEGSTLTGTEFKIVSGTGFTTGMLIREIK